MFGLALQLVLAFGHMHPLFTASGLAPAVAVDVPQSDTNGPEKKTGDAAQDICAICVSIHLASTLVLPSVAALAVPARTPERVDLAGGRFALPRLPPHPFQTRAPPIA